METIEKRRNRSSLIGLFVLCAFVVAMVLSESKESFSKFGRFGNWVASRVFNAPPPITEINMGEFPNPRCSEDNGLGACIGTVITPDDFHPDRIYSLGVAEVGEYGKDLSQVVRFQYSTNNKRGQPMEKALIWTFSGEKAKFPLTVQLRDGNGRLVTEAGLSIY